MLKNFLLLISCVSLINCSFQKHSNQNSNDKLVDKPKVIGVWTDGTTENATFEIDEDSIFYVDNMQRFKYIIKGDSLTIKFDGYDFASKIQKATDDSLILVQDKKVFKSIKLIQL